MNIYANYKSFIIKVCFEYHFTSYYLPIPWKSNFHKLLLSSPIFFVIFPFLCARGDKLFFNWEPHFICSWLYTIQTSHYAICKQYCSNPDCSKTCYIYTKADFLFFCRREAHHVHKDSWGKISYLTSEEHVLFIAFKVNVVCCHLNWRSAAIFLNKKLKPLWLWALAHTISNVRFLKVYKNQKLFLFLKSVRISPI